MRKEIIKLFLVFEKYAKKINVETLVDWFYDTCWKINPDIEEEMILSAAFSYSQHIFSNGINTEVDFKKSMNLFLKEFLPEHKTDNIKYQKETLTTLFPYWTEKEIVSIVKRINISFFRVLKKKKLEILDVINESYLNLKNKNEAISPNYFYTVCRNSLLNKNELKIEEFNKLLIDSDVYDILNTYNQYDLENQLDQFDSGIYKFDNVSVEQHFDDKSLDTTLLTRVTIFARKVLSMNILTKAERKLFEAFIDAVHDEEVSDEKSLLQSVRQKLDIDSANFRQLLKRLRDNFKSPQNRQLRDNLLTFNSQGYDKHTNEIDFLENFIQNIMINLKAYRFSEQELQKMLELKKLFQENGFEIDRFPEVYCDDYDQYKDIFGPIRFDEWVDPLDFTLKPDILGVYCDFTIENNIENKEGKVVLFKDRIETYAKHLTENKNNGFSISENISKLKLLVLIHELGHWLCHWPMAEGDNWKKGYYIDQFGNPMKKTHESLAQLITFWLVENHENLRVFFETNLVPKNNKNEYALYKELISHSIVKIIENVKFLRKHYYLNDEISFHVLKSSKDIEDVSFWKEYFMGDYSKNDKLSNEASEYLTAIFSLFKYEDFTGTENIKNMLLEFIVHLSSKLYKRENAPFYLLFGSVHGKLYGL